jgi:hypothetical protein
MKSNPLKKLVKEIQLKTDKTLDELGKDLGYSGAYFRNEVSKGTNENLLVLVQTKFKDLLQGGTNYTMTAEPGKFQVTEKSLLEKQIALLEEEVSFLREKIQSNLASISDNIIVGRAENRAALEYQMMKDSKGDQKKVEILKEQINKLIHLQLTGGQIKSNSVASGK